MRARIAAWLSVCFGFALIQAYALHPIYAQDIVIAPPEGFEAATEENRTRVDIIYRNQRVVSAMARFNTREITFENPELILTALPDLRDPELVLQALTRPLSVNSERICTPDVRLSSCGVVQTDSVAVIFNQSTLRAELFINPLYTFNRAPAGTFLPAPTISPGLISSISSRSAYDFERDSFVGNHRLRAIAGRGRFAMRGEGFATTDGSGEFTALYATHSGEDRAWSAGLIPPQSNAGLARSRRMFGVRFGTMLDTRLNSDELYATRLNVSISQSATVEIQRDGQTLDVQNLRAGDRAIDTSRLPPGSYQVDLIINEGGNVRRETRFFSTSTRLPPRGSPRWYIELGNAVPLRRRQDGFEDTDPVAVAIGWRQRVAANVGISADGFFSRDTSFFEVGGGYLSARLRADISVLASDRGTVGMSARGNAQLAGWSVNGGGQFLNTVAEDEALKASVYAPFRRAFRQANVAASRSIDWGRYGVSGLYRQDDEGRETWYVGPFLDVTLLNTRRWRLDLNMQAEQSNTLQRGYLGVRLNRTLGRWGVKARQILVSSRIDSNYTRVRRDGAKSHESVLEATAGLNQSVSPRLSVRLEGGVRRQKGLGVFARGAFSAPSVSIDLEGRRNYQNQTSALLNVNTGLALGGGGVSFTSSTEESGLRAHLRGAHDVPVSVQVDHRTRTEANAGQSAFIPLRAYALYDVGIQPGTTDNLAYDQATERLIAYPGNIVQITRSVQPVMIVIGRLVDAEGMALGNTLLRATEGLGVTDPDGYFQIDIAIGETVRATKRGGEVCTFEIPDTIDQTAPYVDLGTVTCN